MRASRESGPAAGSAARRCKDTAMERRGAQASLARDASHHKVRSTKSASRRSFVIRQKQQTVSDGLCPSSDCSRRPEDPCQP